MRPAPTDDLERAVEVANSWDTLEPDPEQVPDATMLGRFLRWIGRPDLRDALVDGDLARFRALRADLHRVFGAPDPDAGRTVLDEIVRAIPAQLRLPAGGPDAEAGGVDPGLRVASASGNAMETLALVCGLALAAELRRTGLRRVGTCAGTPCQCVYVDRSRNRGRRYCSDRCNDRVAQAAHRERIRARRLA